MGRTYSSKKRRATKKSTTPRSVQKAPKKKATKVAKKKPVQQPAKRHGRAQEAREAAEALSRKRALAQKRARKARREREEELARKRSEAAQKGWKTRRKLQKLKKPRATPKTKAELREQNRLLQEKLEALDKDRLEQTKRETKKQVRELEANKTKQQAEVALGVSKSKKPLSKSEQEALIAENLEHFQKGWNQAIIDLRKRGELPEVPKEREEINSRKRTGLAVRVDFDIDLSEENISDVIYELERFSAGLEKEIGDQPTWIAVMTCVSYGRKLIPYGIQMLHTFNLDMAQIQTRGVISTGIWSKREDMLVAAEKELRKVIENKPIIRLLWAVIEAADWKTEEEREAWDKQKSDEKKERKRESE